MKVQSVTFRRLEQAGRARMAGGRGGNRGLRCQTAGRSDVADRTCSMDGCEKHEFARGWCSMHWARWRAHGDPTIVKKRGRPSEAFGSLRERFDAKVEKDYGEWGCWRWVGAHHELGYGRINDRSTGELRQLRAHVVAWEWENGPVPEGEELDHFRFPERCIGPACCNPEHLEPKSHKENSLRSLTAPPAINARRTTCKEGHPFDVVRYVKGRRRRECSICVRRQRQERTARARAERGQN